MINISRYRGSASGFGSQSDTASASGPQRARTHKDSAKSEGVEEGTLSVLRQARVLFGAIANSPGRRSLTWLSVAIVLIISANAVGQIYLNDWRGAWYDALGQRDLDGFVLQLKIFLVIICGLLALVVGETWLHQMVRIRFREWLTHDLLNVWLHPRRVSLLGYAGEIGVNPDQRMHEDARHLSELTVGLGIGLLRSSLLLISFVGVLWTLSSQVQFTWDGATFAIPGYLVWCVLIYAFAGSWLTWLVGRPLIRLNAVRYAREADLRYAMVRVNENAESIALFRGETDERKTLDRPVEGVVDITRQLAGSIAKLTWITSGFGWTGLVVPILVAAPGYFGGYMSFGGLMIVVGAFNQVENALSWFVSNFSNIADWRATLLRVTTFRTALLALDAGQDELPRQAASDAKSAAFVIQNLEVESDNRVIRPASSRVAVEPGQHTLLKGDPGGGGHAVFRALAGLWPKGSGTVHVPPQTSTMFVPQKPYLPLGDIATVMRYPSGSGWMDNQALEHALRRVNLGHLVPHLETVERWDQKLSLDEQQRIILARCLIHAPDWLILDDFLASMDSTSREMMLSMLTDELTNTTVIGVGSGIGLEPLQPAKIALVASPMPSAKAIGTRAVPVVRKERQGLLDGAAPAPTVS